MIKYKYIIIGGGISGCIASEILQDDTLIIERSPKLGGEMSNEILGPKLYHSTDITKTFFKHYIKSIKNIYCKTLKNGVQCNDKSSYNKKIGYSFNNSQNSSISEFQALKLDLESFYNKQKAMISANVIKIDVNKKLVYVLQNKKIHIFSYEYILSTIDYEFFMHLCNLKVSIDLRRRGVLYYNFNADYLEKFEHLSKVDFWYNLSDHEFFRCTNLENGTKTLEIFVEDFGSISEQISKYFKSATDGLVYYNPSAKIWTSSKTLSYNELKWANIYLLGRNALYNHDRIQDVISSMQQIAKEIKNK